MQWANEKKARGTIRYPAVIGAVLYLGYCCDFLDRRYIALLAKYFTNMEERYKEFGKELPQNKDLANDSNKDKIMRHLDCAAIEFMHMKIFDQVKLNIQGKGYSELKLFDTVRGVFNEGGPAFRGAGLFAKSHIQICVRNPNCIQGFFMPREEIDFMGWLESNSPVREAV